MTDKEQIQECCTWAQSRIRHIEKDSRFQDEPADVFINAPLALIQVELTSEHRALRAVLKILKGK